MEYDFKNSIGMLTAKISKSIDQKIESKFKENGFKTTNVEWAVLSCLHNQDYHTQNELGEIVGRNKVFIKRLIDDMENQQLVKRETMGTDRRHNKIIITKTGTELYHKLLPMVEQTIKDVFYDFNEIEVNTLLRLLKIVAKNIT